MGGSLRYAGVLVLSYVLLSSWSQSVVSTSLVHPFKRILTFTDSTMSSPKTITGAAAILYALEEAGVTHMFVNLGSDHPAFLAAFASKMNPRLRLITAPNEMNALSAASGWAQITGKPAAVLVHVECGTQGLGAAVHNISKGRIPVFIFAGTSPITMEGEEIGSRNEYIHWTQDVPDQRAIVRQYMKYEHEIRSPHNAVQLTLRALQFANTTPKGPTYMVASREALERETPHPTSEGNVKPTQQAIKNLAVEPMGLMPSATEELATALASAEKPLIVTSYVGQTVAGFEALRDLAELLAIPVHENAPITNNFPTTSFLHQGHQWNGGGQLPALAEADVVLVVDSDIPWIPVQSKPSDSARVFHIDSDPLKTTMTLWCLPCEKRWQCDSSVALRQLYDHLKCTSLVQEAQSRISARIDLLEKRWEQRKDRLLEAETSPSDGSVTVPYFMARFRKATASLSIIGLNESTTNLPNVADHLGHSEAQTLIGSGGGGLGWWSGAAVGASLALQSQGRADKTLLTAFIGDGTFMFGVPSSAYWMARKYNTPFLTVVWNNGGWAAPRAACLRVHGELADQHTKEDLTESLGVGLTPSVGFGKIAEGAGDAWWRVVENTRDVDAIVEEAVAVVTNGRCAVVEVRLKQI